MKIKVLFHNCFKKSMKLESIKILVSEIDYKLGRIDFFKERLGK